MKLMGINKCMYVFCNAYFQNCGLKTKFLEHFLENSLNNAHITILFTFSNVAFNGFEIVNTLLNKNWKTAEIVVLKISHKT